MMLTDFEKNDALKKSKKLASLIIDSDEGILYYKIFASLIARCSHKDFTYLLDSALSYEMMAENMNTIMQELILLSSVNSNKYYTTGQLSIFFGVSITTINNWINEGRLIGVSRKGRFRHARISDNAIWHSNSGEFITIREIIKMKEIETSSHSGEDEIAAIKKELLLLEKKYRGKLEDTLKQKKDLSFVELKEKEEWQYLINRLKEQSQ